MLLTIRIWLGRLLFGIIGNPTWPTGTLLSRRRLLKWPCEQPELEALRYIAANTTIPVPKVFRASQYHGYLAIEMEYLRECRTLQESWRELSTQQKDDITEQLATYIDQLRALQPPQKTRVSSTGGGPCRDVRIGVSRLFGPFKDVDSFHTFICGNLTIENARTAFGDQVVQIQQRSYEVRYTHGDITASNILVRDGRILAVIDWECAGWFPEYWEYTKSHYNSIYLPEFHQMLDQKITRYDDELEAERILWQKYDQFLDVVRPYDRCAEPV